MRKIIANMSMSLDGFIAGPNDGPNNPMGDGGEMLHDWMFSESDPTRKNSKIVAGLFKNIGATIMGKRMFDNGEGPWGDNPPFHMPVFVLCSKPRKSLVKGGGTTFTFVTNGIENALEQAKNAAGKKDISIGGGANVVRQYLETGLLDELRIHLIPILLGGGVRLFDHVATEKIKLEKISVIDTPNVTHFAFRVLK